MAGEDKSLDTLWREFLIRALYAGGGFGSDVNVTNAYLHTIIDSMPNVTVTDTRGLTERMLAKAPASGYALWLDTADTTYIYVAEAPVADAGTANTFRGIRITKDASGNPLGKVSYLVGFTWNNRASETWP